MDERTGTGVTPERTGLSELEKRQDENPGGAPTSEVGGYGSSSGYETVGAAPPVTPEIGESGGASFGSGTVVPEDRDGSPAISGGNRGEGAREHVQRIRGMASGRIQRTLENRKSFFASELENFAGIFEDVGRSLEERGRGSEKKVTDAAARFTRKASRTLRERSTDEIFESVRGELRERPAVIFAGALALGFLGVRFLRD